MSESRVEVVPQAAPRLLDRVRAVIRARHYSPRTEKAYVFWIRRFIVFNGRRHPDTMAERLARSARYKPPPTTRKSITRSSIA